MSEQFLGTRSRMEPRGDVTGVVKADEAAVSIAISLKRIADALWGIEGTAGVLELLNPLDVRNNY